MVTLVDTLYAWGLTFLIFIGVPTVKLWATDVVTNTSLVGTPGVVPALISVIEIGSSANAPTISHSALCFANPSALVGYFSAIFLVDA